MAVLLHHQLNLYQGGIYCSSKRYNESQINYYLNVIQYQVNFNEENIFLHAQINLTFYPRFINQFLPVELSKFYFIINLGFLISIGQFVFFIGVNLEDIIRLMSKRQKYPRQANQKQKPIKKDPCGNGWHCSNILNYKCQNYHSDQDMKNAKKLKRIKQQSQTIIILDTYDKNLSPICLLQPSLLINVVNQKDINMEIGKYYQANLLDIQKPMSIDFKISKELGQFGKWPIQQEILQKYFPREYDLQKPQKQTKMGQVKINGQLKKVVTIHQGKKIYFQRVNKACIYPLLGGCRVSYYEAGNTIGVTKVNYPHEIKLCGIVQIDNNSQFYFISRNEEYDDMNPFAVPKEMEQKLVQFKGLFPYSLLKFQPIGKEQQTKINSILKEYLVKGKFKGWPLNSRFPIIELIDQINIKNFKSLKDGIIYEAGISMTPFDKKQKQDSQKLVKNFNIDDFSKSRKTFTKSIFTVDNKQTKCHDDAICIIPLENGSFMVQIHIADVAALIQQDDAIDKKIKKRDETIYIKNYYQPMLYDSLKNLLSLSEDQDKLAFTLSFKVNSQGFIDYRTVEFHKNIINVEKNLAHQRIELGQQSYPQLKQVNKLFDKSKLIDNNYILQSETNSQVAISRLIFISSIIPTYLLEVNIERAKKFKEQFQQYLKKIIDQRKNDMEKWEKNLDKIKQSESSENKYKKELKIIQKKIDNQLSKQRKLIAKKLKEQKISNRQICGKIPKKKNESQNDTSQEEDFNEFAQEQNQADQQRQRLQDQQEKQEEKNIQLQLKEKEKRTKALKEVKLEDLQSSDSEQEAKNEDSQDGQIQNQQFRFNAAVGGKKFLEKIFRNPIFNIDIKWKSFQEINNAFKTILSKDDGKLYQQYFKRLQIMNRQHFKYIVKMEKDKNGEKEVNKKTQNMQKTQRRNDRREGYKKDKKIQEKSNIEIKKQLKQEQNSNKQSEKDPQQKQKKLSQQKKQKKPNQQNKKKREERYIRRKKQKQFKHNKQEQDKTQQLQKIEKKEAKNSKKHEKKNPQKNAQQIQINQKLNLKIQQKSDYYINKYKVPFQAGDKLEFSSEQQEVEQNLQVKSMKKDTKRRLILRLLISRSKNEEIKENTQQKNVKGQKLQAIVKNIKEYMESKQQQYVQKYLSQFVIDSKLNNLDISFNQDDQKFIGDWDLKSYKKEKINRLKVILRKQKRQSRKQTKQKQPKVQIAQKQQNLNNIKAEQPKQILIKKEIEGQNKIIQKGEAKLQDVLGKQNENIKQNQQPIQKVQQPRQVKTTKLTKKGLKKKIQQQLEPFIRQLDEKYKEQRQQLKKKIQQMKIKIKQEKNILSQDLQSVHFQYNLLKLLTYQDQPDQNESKKNNKKKLKEKKKKNDKVEKSTILTQFLDNFNHYAQKIGFKFKEMKITELDNYLSDNFSIDKICEDSNDSIQRLNKKASRKGQKQEKLLKWNNPIRSYESLKVMRMIKYSKWLFQGQLFPTDVIRYYSDIKDVQKQMKQLEDYRTKKMQKGELNKKVKESNRQISKLQFYNLLKRDQNTIFYFLNIGSPCPEKVKFVFHPILEQVQVNNLNFKQQIYKQVKGRVLIVREFPLKFRINLEK